MAERRTPVMEASNQGYAVTLCRTLVYSAVRRRFNERSETLSRHCWQRLSAPTYNL